MNTKVAGHIEIVPAAIELIIGIAVSKMKDVHSVQGSVRASSGIDLLSKVLVTKGVILDTNEQGDYVADIYVSLKYGVRVPEVARKIQERVKEQVMFMCDIDIKEVHVHVTQLVSETGEQSE